MEHIKLLTWFHSNDSLTAVLCKSNQTMWVKPTVKYAVLCCAGHGVSEEAAEALIDCQSLLCSILSLTFCREMRCCCWVNLDELAAKGNWFQWAQIESYEWTHIGLLANKFDILCFPHSLHSCWSKLFMVHCTALGASITVPSSFFDQRLFSMLISDIFWWSNIVMLPS